MKITTFPCSKSPSYLTLLFFLSKVITADGWAEPRVVIAINGTVPGPLIEVHEQQIVRVHVHNKMRSEATTVHFHGQPQRGTPWMDGVSFITQCPVLPGQTFTYQVTCRSRDNYACLSLAGVSSVTQCPVLSKPLTLQITSHSSESSCL